MSLEQTAGTPAVQRVRQIAREGMVEHYAVSPGCSPEELLKLAEHLRATACGERSAGEPIAAGGLLAAECFGCHPEDAHSISANAGVPVTWVNGGTHGPGLGGIHLHAVTGGTVTPLILDGVLVGATLTGPYAVECFLSGLCTTDTSAPRPQQARATFERMEQALALADMDFSHVARTWLFLDDILAWYNDFNKVRTQFFTDRGVFDRVVPASTGIGGSNPAGAAMMTGVYAIRPLAPGVSFQALPSPLQCPALQYGSSFSRAVEVTMPDLRRVFVSGTASIAPGGETVHIGDVLGQTARTCEVVEAILRSRGMGWEDVTRATAYVRFPEDAGIFEQFRSQSHIPPLPVITTHNVVCRDDLLFEIEVDAVRAT